MLFKWFVHSLMTGVVNSESRDEDATRIGTAEKSNHVQCELAHAHRVLEPLHLNQIELVVLGADAVLRH